MNLKNKMIVIFLLCFIVIKSWCETDEEEQITIGGYTYSINTNEKNIRFSGRTAFESLDGIEQLEKLEGLAIEINTIPLKDISAIGKLDNLTELIISGRGGEFRIRDIIGASKLKSLTIGNNATVDLEGIENFPELEEITIDSSFTTNYESLIKLKKLKTLSFNIPTQNTNLQFLANIPTLEQLTLSAEHREDGTWAPADPATYIEIDVGFLRKLKNLQSIAFKRINVKNFNLLSELPELIFTNIREAAIDDVDRSLFRDDFYILDYYDH